MRYCIFFIKDEKLIAVEKMAPRDANYEEFLGDLMACGPEDCRYGLYDFEYEHQCQGTSEKTRKEKLLLMSWCPDTARIKKKMLYSSSFDALKKCLVGAQKAQILAWRSSWLIRGIEISLCILKPTSVFFFFSYQPLPIRIPSKILYILNPPVFVKFGWKKQ